MNAHPNRDEADAPLWVKIGGNKTEMMDYAALRAVVLRLVGRAGIRIRVYPHLFRHNRVTHLLVNKQISEAQAKVYFGWTPDSKMLSNYAHLVSRDVNDAILEIHGIKSGEEKKSSKLKPRQCPRCGSVNPKSASFCYKCGMVLDFKTATRLERRRVESDDVVMRLARDSKVQKVLVERVFALGLQDKLRELGVM